MSFNQFLMILKSRYKILLTVFLLTVISSIAYTLTAPKKYKANASVLLNYKGVDPITGAILPAQLMLGYMATQIDIVKSANVAKKVVSELGIAENESAIEQFNEASKGKGDVKEWYANLLLKNIEVIPSKESSLINIIFEGNDPDFVALVANSFAKEYIKTNIELKVEPAKVAATFLKDQIAGLRIKLENAQSNLSTYQQKYGLTSLNGSIDVEIARLNELSTQLVVAQSQLYDSKSRQSNNAPDVEANPIVQNLRLSVSVAEAKLAEVSSKYGTSHPQYIAMSAELSKQRNQLNAAISKSRSSISATNKIARERVTELETALKNQKEKVLNLNLTRDELSVLQTEVLNAQEALATASNRFNQVSQDSSANQSDVTILNYASSPLLPSSPNVPLNIILSIFAGLILGVFCTILAELPNKKVRSKEDIINIIDVPVFSIISNNSSHDKKKLFKKDPIIFNKIQGLIHEK